MMHRYLYDIRIGVGPLREQGDETYDDPGVVSHFPYISTDDRKLPDKLHAVQQECQKPSKTSSYLVYVRGYWIGQDGLGGPEGEEDWDLNLGERCRFRGCGVVTFDEGSLLVCIFE
jgi:hypothetical protein